MRAMAMAALINPATAPTASGVTVQVATADDTTLGLFPSAQDMVTQGFVAPTGGQIYYNTANGRAAIFNQNREGEVGNFGTLGFAAPVPVPPPLQSDPTKTGVSATGPFNLYHRTDAPRLLFRMSNVVSGGVRVLVNGQYVDPVGHDVTGSSQYLIIDFAGVRAVRDITIQLQGLVVLFSTRIDAYSRWYDPTPADPFSILWHGDSHTESGTNAAPYWASACHIVGERLGAWENWNAGFASTKYTGLGGASGLRFTIGDAMKRTLTKRAWTMVVVRGCFNDIGQPSAAITAAVLAALREIRRTNPYALIVVLGVEGGATGPSAGIIAAEVAKKAAFDAFADNFSLWIPLSTRAKPVHFGTGRVGALAKDQNPVGITGNSDLYFGPDSTPAHANAAGEAYLGRLLASELQRLVPGIPV
ncbi:hypothetical protein [uncultured Sphingomonas sp.]|uniref:hypothetical protein n=1 Tax=uncultured Sphingomonas sp. TaxID=158754 RepID=UPI0025EC98A7|nr:hypothetical protein [uncultured Sphingomonas sp.]